MALPMSFQVLVSTPEAFKAAQRTSPLLKWSAFGVVVFDEVCEIKISVCVFYLIVNCWCSVWVFGFRFLAVHIICGWNPSGNIIYFFIFCSVDVFASTFPSAGIVRVLVLSQVE